jgi:hypothetical protein
MKVFVSSYVIDERGVRVVVRKYLVMSGQISKIEQVRD